MKMIDVHQAFNLMRDHWPVLGTETVDLEDCGGRILAEDNYARVTVPPFDASAMDGFAVRFEHVQHIGAALTLLGEVPAGAPNPYALNSGECVRVFTGSPMPQGADHVLIQEHSVFEGNQVRVTKAQNEARHIRKAGGDFHEGDRVLQIGTRLSYAEIGLAAAANYGSLVVYKQPKISILTTGTELCPPGSELDAGQIVESNSHTIAQLLSAAGATVKRLAIATDDEACIESRFKDASDADIIITVGGASVGKHDLLRNVFSELGGDFIFQRLAVRPGKPTWFGKIGEQIVIGLPGNPTAAIVIALLLVRPRLLFKESLMFTDAVLATDIPANGARETFARARLTLENGAARVYSLKDQDTSRVQVLTSTNCLLHRPVNDAEKSIGDVVQVVLLD